jgi:hypothetical protein
MLEEALTMQTGQGRAFRDGIFSTAGADGGYGAHLRAYADGVLGDAGRAYADGVLARTKPSAAYGTRRTAYSDGVLGAAFRGGVLDTPYNMRARDDGVLGVLDTLSDGQKMAIGIGGLALAAGIVFVVARR